MACDVKVKLNVYKFHLTTYNAIRSSIYFFPKRRPNEHYAASIQPNLFWFLEKYHCFFRVLLVFKSANVLKNMSEVENVRNGHIYIQLMKQHVT